jgi:glucosamine-phosphate N-acetyltransferase
MSDPLFSPSALPTSQQLGLPDSYTVRPLNIKDYHNGFLDVLRVLTTVGDITEAAWNDRYSWMAKKNAEGVEYAVLCIEDGQGKVVGTGCLLIERKLYVLPTSGRDQSQG